MFGMADESGILPLALIAGAGYILWKYWSTTTVVSPPAQTTPGTPQQSAISTAQPSTYPAYAPFQNQRVLKTVPGQTRPAPNPNWRPGSGISQPDPSTMPDTSSMYTKPTLIDTNPIYNPPVQPAMTPEQLDFQRRCTYIDGNWIPGCA